MLPWKTIIQVQRDIDSPVFLQIANAVIQEMKRGRVGPNIKLPGTRTMAEILQVHRKTIVSAYEELTAQGWIETVPSKGTFTSKKLPEINPRLFISQPTIRYSFPQRTGYIVKVNDRIKTPSSPSRHITGFHDGPDVRLMPFEQIGRTYKSILARHVNLKYLSYVETIGVHKFIGILSEYLNSSRGLQTSPENIMITRGSQMGLFLVASVLFTKGDSVIVGDTSYYYADATFQTAKVNLVRVRVDDFGIDVDAVEKICKRKKIRAIYITSHHHYPTTVTLIAERRIKLLSLANKFGFIIIEEDYDYDFHYLSSPILPLISADAKGMVVYLGTFSKSLAPAVRTGYVVGPENLILELSRLRQLIDVQGDPIMELTLAEMFQDGEIKRHMKKLLREYHQRRDLFCNLLAQKLSHVIEFKIPDGGLSVWSKYDKSISLPKLAEQLKTKGIILSNGLIHNTSPVSLNCTRMGFAWMNEVEMERAVNILAETIKRK